MTPRALEIMQELLNGLHLSGRDSVSKTYSNADMPALQEVLPKMAEAGYDFTIEALPHSGYKSVRVSRKPPVVTDGHICCPCAAN